MEDKHFEPVTARSLARDFYSKAMAIYHSGVNFDRGMNMLLEIIEPHIRKPSDGFEMPFDLPDDISMLSERFNRIIKGCKSAADRSSQIESLKEDVINALLYYKKESVPARCEEAYNEAVELIRFINSCIYGTGYEGLHKRIAYFMQQPNPFKEADIVKEDDPEPTLLPFDLGLAARGHKVVTKDLIEVKIVAEGLSGDWPILAVYTDRYGAKQFDEFDLKGQRKDIIDDSLNLFILKEPETVDIHIYRDVSANRMFAWVDEKAPDNEEYALIKTITVTT